MKTRFVIVLFSGIVVLSFLLTSFVTAKSIAGQTFTVTATTDVIDSQPGDGVCETAPGNGMCTLRAAIMEANALIGKDTIMLPEETYNLIIAGADEDEAATGDLDITDALTIQGPTSANAYASIDATGLGDRVLHVLSDSEDVSITKVEIRGGEGDIGGGIRNESWLRLTDARVMQNDASVNGGGIWSSYALVLINVSFSNNTASYAGGGFFSSGVLDVKNCFIRGNSANEEGGGAYIGGTFTPEISDSEFSNNTADSGGGLYIKDLLTIVNSIIVDNTSTTHGGGIYNTGELTIQDANIYQNSAEAAGGGILNQGELSIEDSYIDSNSAGLGGGGIYNDAAGSIFFDNVSIDENNCPFYGGGILNYGTIQGRLVLFNLNSASNGGAIANSAGGRIELEQATFSNSTATNDGGAIVNTLFSDALMLTDSTIISNTAGANGGGISNTGFTQLTRVTLTDNQAENGGAIYTSVNDSLSIENSTISGNAADLNGGGIYSEGTTFLFHSTLTGNKASADPISPSGSGGGVFNVGDALFYFADSILYGNYRQTIGPVASDCNGTLTTMHYNLVGTLDDCTLADDQGLDLIGVDPLLGTLADNGGPTLTRALQPGSPAIDAADPAGCLSLVNLPLTIDQRGHLLPRDGDMDGEARCDIGAYEAPLAMLYLPITVK